MPTRTVHEYADHDKNGVWDYHRQTTTVTDAEGREEYWAEWFDADNNGAFDWASYRDNTWNGQQISATEFGFDPEADGVFQQKSNQVFAYRADGKLEYSLLSSQDGSGDGQPDWQILVSNTYDGAGRITQEHTSNFTDGVLSPYEYRIETSAYNAKGLLHEFTVDDTAVYDFEVSWRYSYNSRNQLTRVEHRDEFDFGDNNYHNAEAYKWSKTQLLESNIYPAFLNGEHGLELKTKFSYDGAGRVKWELATLQDWSWHTTERQLTEHWYNADGRETHTLISRDPEADGTWNPGDRDLIVTSYFEDGSVASITRDNDVGDGIVESLWIADPLVA